MTGYIPRVWDEETIDKMSTTDLTNCITSMAACVGAGWWVRLSLQTGDYLDDTHAITFVEKVLDERNKEWEEQ